MSAFENQVECNVHGASQMAFVCKHLNAGEKLGFNYAYDPEEPDSLTPDAWCDDCDAVLDEEGEWNERATEFADIQLVCAHCYEEIREKNWLQDDESLATLISECFQFIEPRHKDFLANYKAGQHERWDWDQASAKLIFSHNGIVQVEADIQFAGTYSSKNQTWMWAWANDSLHDNVKVASRAIRSLGEEQDFKQLACGQFLATEVDGWELSAVLAKHLDAIGLYRTRNENGFTYMVVTKAQWMVKESQ